jgi:hypothetical protein
MLSELPRIVCAHTLNYYYSDCKTGFINLTPRQKPRGQARVANLTAEVGRLIDIDDVLEGGLMNDVVEDLSSQFNQLDRCCCSLTMEDTFFECITSFESRQPTIRELDHLVWWNSHVDSNPTSLGLDKLAGYTKIAALHLRETNVRVPGAVIGMMRYGSPFAHLPYPLPSNKIHS